MEHPPVSQPLTAQLRGVYESRRDRVYHLLGESGALVLPASPELMVGRDTEVRYIVDPELYYLTGYTEPEAVAVFMPGHDQPFTLFVRSRDPARELWTGVRGGTDAAVAVYGANQAYSIYELAERLPHLLADVEVIYTRLNQGRHDVDELLRVALERARRSRPRTGRGPHTLTDPGVLLDDMRVIKDAHELELLRQAAELTVHGFLDAAARIRPGAGEWEIEAALESGFRARGGDGFAFPTIVAGGANATVLHYVSNNSRLRAGDLVLIDAGARCGMYCGDISRTFPVNGRFSPVQRELYDAVLRARAAAIAAARPGATVDEVHRAALLELLPVLANYGLLDGTNLQDALSDEDSYRNFCPHKTSHWLGLEVHDVGAYAFHAGARPLAPGMVLTIEPGLYIPRDCAAAPAEMRGLGMRIEDDIVITEQGADVLTAALPSEADQVEALLAGS